MRIYRWKNQYYLLFSHLFATLANLPHTRTTLFIEYGHNTRFPLHKIIMVLYQARPNICAKHNIIIICSIAFEAFTNRKTNSQNNNNKKGRKTGNEKGKNKKKKHLMKQTHIINKTKYTIKYNRLLIKDIIYTRPSTPFCVCPRIFPSPTPHCFTQCALANKSIIK